MRLRNPGDLGELLRYARRANDMTQLELAEWLGVSRHYVRVLESGEHTERLERTFSAISVLGFELHGGPRGEVISQPLPVPEPEDD